MATPQNAIFNEDSAHHYYMEYRINREAELQAVRDALVGFGNVHRTVEPRVNLVVGFGPELWAQLAPQGMPENFQKFEVINGVDGYHNPATQRDIWCWIHSHSLDDNFDAALEIERVFSGVASLELDERGFTYHDSRDLTGFIDGSANPKDEKARQAALIPEGNAGAGGAFVVTQKWVHDLDRFLALPVSEQEAIIGRTKAESIELEGEAMPATSHVSRTDLSENGEAMKIYRRSAPFGNVSDKGLYFLAFSCAQRRIDIQLKSMFGASGDGLHDRLVEFSRPVSSSYWFAPSIEALEELY